MSKKKKVEEKETTHSTLNTVILSIGFAYGVVGTITSETLFAKLVLILFATKGFLLLLNELNSEDEE